MNTKFEYKTVDSLAIRLTDYVANGSFASLAENVQYQGSPSYAILIRLTDFNNSFRGPFIYVDEKAYAFLNKSSLRPGDIIISNVGANVGTVFLCPNLDTKMTLGPNAITVRFNGIDRFYYYWFLSPKGQASISSIVTGSAQPKFNKTNFKQLLVPVPPLDYQRAVVRILDSIDKKIEINDKINGCLEAHIKYHFSRFFGSNDGKSVKIGELPVVVTDYVANGSFASLKENVTIFEEPDYAVFIRNTDLKSGSFKTYVDERAYHFLSKSTLFGGEIIVSNVGDIGSVFICPKLDKPMTLGNNIIMVKTKNASLNHFLYCWLKWFGGQRAMQGIATGSAVPKFNKTEFKGLQLKLPAQMVLKKFETQVGQMFSMSENLQTENKRLSILRDSILPKLMSGEINVDAIEIN